MNLRKWYKSLRTVRPEQGVNATKMQGVTKSEKKWEYFREKNQIIRFKMTEDGD